MFKFCSADMKWIQEELPFAISQIFGHFQNIQKKINDEIFININFDLVKYLTLHDTGLIVRYGPLNWTWNDHKWYNNSRKALSTLYDYRW